MVNNKEKYPLFERFVKIDGKKMAVFSTSEFVDTKEEADKILKERGYYDL